MNFDGTISVVAAYILGRANAYREIADVAAYAEMRICHESAQSMAVARGHDKFGRTFRDEHRPGAERHLVNREYRLDNGPGERGHVPVTKYVRVS